jgi:hypothetical protein
LSSKRQDHIFPHGEGRDEVEELKDKSDVLAAVQRALQIIESRESGGHQYKYWPSSARSIPLTRFNSVVLPLPLFPKDGSELPLLEFATVACCKTGRRRFSAFKIGFGQILQTQKTHAANSHGFRLVILS